MTTPQPGQRLSQGGKHIIIDFVERDTVFYRLFRGDTLIAALRASVAEFVALVGD